MRILMIAATPFFSDRGCHIRIYDEIKYLQKNGFETVLCTYHLGNDPVGIDEKKIKRIINIPWYKKLTPGASWHKVYLDFLLFLISFKEYLKLKPKIIHAHLYEGLFIAFIIKILTFGRVKIIFDCQGSLAEEMYYYTLSRNKFYKLFYKLFKLIEKLLLYFPNFIFCSSKNSYNFLVNEYKIKKNKISILEDAVDSEVFATITSDQIQEFKDELGLPKDNLVIVYTGSMVHSKGAGELVDAIPSILASNEKITFLMVGYGEDLSGYQKKLNRYLESKNVIFTGRANYFDLPKYLRLANFAIDPKKDISESSGKLLNYMAAGLPIFCFRNKNNFDVLKDNGIYLNNFREIVDAVNRVGIKNINYNVLVWKEGVYKLIHKYQNYAHRN
jgi:glycosyltransferase involved in cell wall biosynthesis